MTPEEKLEALLKAEAAPVHDLAFATAVMEQVARRRAWLTALAATPWAAIAAVALWALHPLLAPAGPTLAAAGAILALTWALLAATRGALARLPAP